MDTNKVVICGEANSGKTSLFNYLVDESFPVEHVPTKISQQGSFEVDAESEHITVNVWDISGDPNVRQLLTPYFRNIDILLFVVDISNHKSYEAMRSWIDLSRTNDAITKGVMILIVNKTDEDNIAVKDSEIDNLVSNNHFAETYRISLKNKEGLDGIKKRLGEICLAQARQRMEDMRNPPVDIKEPTATKKSKCC